MAWIPFSRRTRTTPRSAPGFGAAEIEQLSDAELIRLFEEDPASAWRAFLERYADLVLSTLHYLGFDHDEAMDRFVYVCEKLSEDRCRRLREVKFLGERGELVPWIRTVVRNLSISWTRSVEGRRRLFGSIEGLPRRQQRIFELYFWQGLAPSEVHEYLRVEEQADIAFTEVLDGLDSVFEHLDANQRWRLASGLARRRAALVIDDPDPETGLAFEPESTDMGPEASLLGKERSERLQSAVGALAVRDRLILQLRYEEASSLKEVAEMVRVSVSTVKSSLRASLETLRRASGLELPS